MSAPQKFRLGDALVLRGLITQEQLAQALAEQKRTGRKLGRVLNDLDFASDEAIGETVAQQMKLPFVDLRKRELGSALVRRLSEAQARRFRAIVLEEQGGGLVVGFADPTDIHAQDEVARLLRTTIHPVVVTERTLLAGVDRIYQRGEEISGLANEVAADLGPSMPTVAPLDLNVGSDDAPIVRLLQSIFEAAVSQQVSDIHVEPQEKNLVIRFRIDGVMHVQSSYDQKIATAIVQRLKLMSSLDISEKRLPQDGRFQISVGSHAIDVRISTLPTQYGESVVMRLLAQNAERMKLDLIGIPDAILARLRVALKATSGLILVTGPTGSGKTTTLYAALAELNNSETKIITVEDPVEYRLPGLNQVQVHDKIDLSFARVLRSCLRQDPDVLLVGEMRDQETAEIGLRAALTGHLVLSTLHTNDAAGAAMRLADMGIPPYMVGLGLRLVIAQRLVRVLCEHCKQPHEPDAFEREWLRLAQQDPAEAGRPGGPGYFSGVGCSHCRNTGYRGRTGVYEMIEMTPELVHAASAGDPGEFTRIAQEQFAAFTLRADAVRLARLGRTTLAEAMRVSNQA
jgi:MSHA biogenesis protein MshE